MTSDNIFSSALPLEDNFVNNLGYLAGRMNSNASRTMADARKSIEVYKTKLFEYCVEFCTSGIERIERPSARGVKKLHFVYRINLMRHWQSKMVIADENGMLALRLIGGPPMIAVLQGRYGREDAGLEQEYMLMKLLLEFNSFYKKSGLIFPAYIELYGDS